MKNVIFGLIIGLVLAAVVLVPLLFHEQRVKFNLGRHCGRIEGLNEAADSLDKVFGKYDGKVEYKILFSVKTTSVVSIETNGVKTVRIIP